ncbi:hypothetical protein [Mycoavidus cysteinexigens]|nr:hypothetical protein [Mycoavidus cysteinexigens]GAM51655.1 hypothetical protein EBME_0118 [bacterium endosymbiont of Mortierella elongata FMR23-6]
MTRLENDNALLRAALRADRIEAFIKASAVFISMIACLLSMFFILTHWR